MEVSTADKTVRDDVAVRVRSKTQKNKVVREGWVQKQQAGKGRTLGQYFLALLVSLTLHPDAR